MKKLMYAIAFDFDTKKLEKQFGPSYTNKYKEIETFFNEHHFHWKQGSLYYGDLDRSKVDMPKTFAMLTKLSRTFPWFKDCVRDVRILTIQDDDNLIDYLKNA